MESYTTTNAARLLSVSAETIRRYALAFDEYLSPTATPASGRTRYFTRDDLAVLSLITSMKARGMPDPDIHAALKNGERGEVPDATPDELEAVAIADNERRLMRQVDYLEKQLGDLRGELDTLRAENSELKQQLAASQKEAELKYQIGKLEGELEFRRKQDDLRG